MRRDWVRGKEGARRGFRFGCLLLLLMAVSAAIFAALDFLSFVVLHLQQTGFALSVIPIFGFMPAVGIGALPWILLVFKQGNFGLTVAVAFAGFLLNSTLFGAIIGFPDPYAAMRALLLPWWWRKASEKRARARQRP